MSHRDEVARLEAEVEDLREALRPFAMHADEIEKREATAPGFRFDDEWPNPISCGLTVGMFRRARAVLGTASDDSVAEIMAAPSAVMSAAEPQDEHEAH